MPKIRILIADDHALVREGIIALLRLYEDVVVIGEASNGKEAIEKVKTLNPDIVLMDISMPGLGGLEATIEIKKGSPDVKILVLSQYDDREYISRFLNAGVSGYLLKKAGWRRSDNGYQGGKQGRIIPSSFNHFRDSFRVFKKRNSAFYARPIRKAYR